MADITFTPDEEAALLGLLAKFNGDPEALHRAALSAYGATLTKTAASSLSGVSLKVSDWGPVDAAIAAGNPRSIPAILADLTAQFLKHDDSSAGPLLVALVGAAKKHFGL